MDPELVNQKIKEAEDNVKAKKEALESSKLMDFMTKCDTIITGYSTLINSYESESEQWKDLCIQILECINSTLPFDEAIFKNLMELIDSINTDMVSTERIENVEASKQKMTELTEKLKKYTEERENINKKTANCKKVETSDEPSTEPVSDSTSSDASSETPDVSSEQASIPEGWTATWDKDNNAFYYVSPDGESTWEKPSVDSTSKKEEIPNDSLSDEEELNKQLGHDSVKGTEAYSEGLGFGDNDPSEFSDDWNEGTDEEGVPVWYSASRNVTLYEPPSEEQRVNAVKPAVVQSDDEDDDDDELPLPQGWKKVKEDGLWYYVSPEGKYQVEHPDKKAFSTEGLEIESAEKKDDPYEDIEETDNATPIIDETTEYDGAVESKDISFQGPRFPNPMSGGGGDPLDESSESKDDEVKEPLNNEDDYGINEFAKDMDIVPHGSAYYNATEEMSFTELFARYGDSPNEPEEV
tara:strand:+ start:15903 stop:17306 length:1404 start_codon:yes stop_codon:yes gene_type:complete